MRGEEGVTLIEIAVVVALIALLVAIAVPSLSAYGRRQMARSRAQLVGDTLAEVRALAIKEGNPYYVHLDPNDVLVIVDDDDADFQHDPNEIERKVKPFYLTEPISRYGALVGPPSASTVPEDGGGAVPSAGVTFPTDAVTGDPGLAFNSQGFPMSMPPALGSPPGAPGSGAGTFYVTDNDEVVYAVTLSPLGATRLRVFRPGIGDWY